MNRLKRALTNLFPLGVAICAIAPPTPVHADCAQAPSGLVAWWRAENNTLDRISQLSGTTGGVTYGGGAVGQAFVFSGSDYIQFPSSTALKFTGPFTIEAWVKLGSDGQGNYTIISKGVDMDYPADWAFTINYGHLRPHVNLDGNWHYFDCDTAMDVGVWYHVAMVYDGSVIKGYLNGVEDGFVEVSGSVQATDEPLRIGVYSINDNHAYYTGSIDELSLYNRALSGSEIQAIINADGDGKCEPCPAPLAWWAAEGNASDSVASHDGVLNGVTFTSGQIGQAFSFNGSSYVRVPSAIDLKFSGNHPFSVDAWVKFSADGYNGIITKGYDSPNGAMEWGLAINNGKLQPQVRISGLWCSVNCNTLLTPNTWYHVAMVYDGASIKGYVNGTADGSLAVSGTLNNAGNESIRIGAFSSTSGFFLGSIDEVGLYAHALSVLDVQALYTAGKSALCPLPEPACTSEASDAIAWWRAEDNTTDSSLSGLHDGTFWGGSAYSAGRVGQAFNFTGANYVTVPNAVALQFSGSFSIEAWIKFDTSGSNTIVAKGINTGEAQDYALFITPNNRLRPQAKINGQSYHVDGIAPLYPGAWYHVAMVYDGSQLRGYVNGALDSSLNVSGSVTTSSHALKIGVHRPDPTLGYFHGGIDELSLYNRPLSATEIERLYLAGTGGKCVPPPPPPCMSEAPDAVAWWKAESDTTDFSLSGVHDGTFLGNASYTAGQVGQAFHFTGANYVSVASTAALKFSGSFSIEGWVRYTTGGNNVIVAKGIDANQGVDYAMSISTNNKLRPHAKINGIWHYFDCSTPLSADVWYHVAMVYDGTALRGYVNGVQNGSFTVSGSVQVSDYALKIGVYSPAANHGYFRGDVDELSLYGRALSPNDISEIYEAGASGKCPPNS